MKFAVFSGIHLDVHPTPRAFWSCPTRSSSATTTNPGGSDGYHDGIPTGGKNEFREFTSVFLFRYLRRGYAKAMSVVDPNLVIFMGDLLDEGVGMTEAQFVETRSRFERTFPASLADVGILSSRCIY